MSANILFCPALNQTLALFAPNGNDCSLYHGVMRQVGLHIDNCFLYCCILTLNVLTGNDWRPVSWRVQRGAPLLIINRRWCIFIYIYTSLIYLGGAEAARLRQPCLGNVWYAMGYNLLRGGLTYVYMFSLCSPFFFSCFVLNVFCVCVTLSFICVWQRTRKKIAPSWLTRFT